jgi:hypothetical protein
MEADDAAARAVEIARSYSNVEPVSADVQAAWADVPDRQPIILTKEAISELMKLLDLLPLLTFDIADVTLARSTGKADAVDSALENMAPHVGQITQALTQFRRAVQVANVDGVNDERR